jgi:hypothetical protein
MLRSSLLIVEWCARVGFDLLAKMGAGDLSVLAFSV